MTKFLIHETELCEVTFVKEVEAETSEEALNKSFEGDSSLLGVGIGDISPMSRATSEVLPYAPYNFPPCFYKEPA